MVQPIQRLIGGVLGIASPSSPSSPGAPPVPAPVTPPARTDPDVTDAARRARQAAANARGRGSTILTSELGVTQGAPGRRRTLGGGA